MPRTYLGGPTIYHRKRIAHMSAVMRHPEESIVCHKERKSKPVGHTLDMSRKEQDKIALNAYLDRHARRF